MVRLDQQQPSRQDVIVENPSGRLDEVVEIPNVAWPSTGYRYIDP